MKAMLFRRHGGPEVIESAEVETPEPGPGEARVRVHAVALNHLDIFVRNGIPGLDLTLPHVGGSDVSGVVDALGEGAGDVAIGTRVLVNPSLFCGSCESCLRGEHSLCLRYRILGEHTWGGFAEEVVVPARNLVPIPDGVAYTDAAAVPLTFQTAWRALFTQGRLTPGETLLVLGASGGVAVAAIQMARLAGAFVFAVTSGSENVRRVVELGADVVLDRNEVDFSKEVWRHTRKRGVDMVLENVGQATWKGSLRALTRGGRLVTYGATTGPMGETDIRLIFWKQISIIGTTMSSDADFRRAMSLFLAGRLRAVVSDVLSIENLRTAHEILERGNQFGKVVCSVP